MLVTVYLVSLDGSNLLVLLDVVADLCDLVRWEFCRSSKAILTF
jgi:hypothetical protein